MVNSILDEVGDAIHFLRDPTGGGVATVLNEIAGQRQVGINVLVELAKEELRTISSVNNFREFVSIMQQLLILLAGRVTQNFQNISCILAN